MSIRQPKPKQIRLPFAVPRPKKGAEPPARVCGICRAADSRYTCPRCNVPYCSLACFRAPAHTQCSEPFYRSTVHEQIAADPRAEMAEKKKMMDMLRRFEEAAADGEDTLAALEAEDEDDLDDALTAALDGVDLDNIDSNELLRLLPQGHRDAFLAALRDPESAEAKALLDSAIEAGEGEEGGAPTLLPWWEADALDEDGEAAHAPPPSDIAPEVLAGITPPPGVGIKTAYNVVALCVAYVHVLLSFRLPSLDGLSPAEMQAVKAELTDLLPFLAPRSVVRYQSTREAWSAVWEKIGQQALDDGAPPLPTTALERLLSTVARMLHPPLTMEPPEAALVLADANAACSVPKAGPAARKVAFYRAAVNQIGRQEWLALEREMERDVEKLRVENRKEEPEAGRESIQINQAPRAPAPAQPTGARIELLN